MTNRCRMLIAACALSVSMLPAKLAHAGSFEQLLQVAFHPSDPNMFVVRYELYTGGLLITRDGGRTFSLTCGAAIRRPEDLPNSGIGATAIANDGRIYVSTNATLWRDDGTGCGWSGEPVADTHWVTDFAQHPSDPEVTFAVIGHSPPTPNVLARRDEGGVFEELGTGRDMLIFRVRVAALPDGSLRYYESGIDDFVEVETDAGVTFAYIQVLRYSDDEGETWTENAVGVVDGTALSLEAVDPTNPDRIVLSIVRNRSSESLVVAPDSIMVSNDRGATLTEWTTVTTLAGVTFSPDGEIWIADEGDIGIPDAPRGIVHARSLDDEPEVLNAEINARCVSYHDGTLYVCQKLELDRLDPSTGELDRIVHFTEVDSVTSCEDMDITAACRMQFCTGYCLNHFQSAPVCVEAYRNDPDALIGCPHTTAAEDAGTDAGDDAGDDAGGAAADAGGVAVPNKSRGGGCTIAVPGPGGSHRSGVSAALFMACMLFALGITQVRSARRVRSLSRSQVEGAIVTL